MASRISKWRRVNKQLLLDLESETDVEEMDVVEEEEVSPQATDLPDSDVDDFDSIGNMVYLDSVTDDNLFDEISSISDESDDGNSVSLVSDIAAWAIKNNITHLALNELLSLLKKNVNVDLPVDARTVLKTPRSVEIVEKCGGEYVYFGVEESVLNHVKPSAEKISMVVNVDGLPLFKSSDIQIWPILATINGGNPFMIGNFCGSNKPNSADLFLNDFLREYGNLVKTGIKVNNDVRPFEIKCFTCDAPARQFLKKTKGHTGYYSCERCTVKGERIDKTMTFKDTSCSLRNDIDFNLQKYGNHQHSKSILSTYGINCVSRFPLDYMHLVCLGVVKRSLYFLKDGPRICKLSHMQIDLISNKLISLRNQLPSELARQPRSLSHLKRWKATEFKQFLIYTGMFVMKGVVSKQVYEHFMSLSISITVMLSYREDDQDYLDLLDFVQSLLKWFVDNSSNIYGHCFVSYNVHSLIHLPDDVRNFKCGLQELSTFPFENFMQRIKKMIRKNHQALPQVVRRVKEMEENDLKYSSKQIPLKIISADINDRDSWFLLNNNKICEVVGPKSKEEQIDARLYCFKKTQPFFTEPINSKLLQICYLKKNSSFVRSRVLINDIIKKFVAIPDKDGTLLIPMVHNIMENQ